MVPMQILPIKQSFSLIIIFYCITHNMVHVYAIIILLYTYFIMYSIANIIMDTLSTFYTY